VSRTDTNQVKVAVVGGAGWFSVDLIRRIYKERLPIELALYDVHAAKLEAVGATIELVSEATGHEVRYEICSELREALSGAGHVISSFCVDHVPARARDMEVCARYGVHPCEGETATPGGLMNTIRHLPILLEVCREMERECPDALLHVLNNPLNRLCYGVTQQSSIKVIGHCDGLDHTINEIARGIGRDAGDIGVIAAGVNHLSFILGLYDVKTGEDLEPLLAARVDDVVQTGPFGFRFSTLVYRLLGYFPCPGDNHIADQLPFVSERMKSELPIHTLDVIYPDPADVTAGRGPQERGVLDLPGHLRSHPDAITRFADPAGREKLAECILAWEGLAPPLHTPNLNIPNGGLVPNLRADAIVEVPGVVSKGQIRGEGVGALPAPLAEVCGRMAMAHCSAVDAVVNADREAALLSLAYEPTVRDLTVVEDLLDDLLDVNAHLMSEELYAGLRKPGRRGRVSVAPAEGPGEIEPSRYQTGLLHSL
jgi:alpha-galactosidase